MAVDFVNNIKEKGHNIQKIIMDDDATTIAKIRREVDASVEKCSDRDHTVKTFTNTLCALQKKKHNSEVIKFNNHQPYKEVLYLCIVFNYEQSDWNEAKSFSYSTSLVW